ncbi:M20/M25/M40 family metallo-hydrolase [Chryseobacterium sp. JV558]|uniref:M20/M25/M40 family metallo-hydrolase n=1 Tax=Chryseobacterium sp. JV558 TaxID=2663236 RepID=UPI00299DCCCF|nr:M20/M25/M40 family metallo-hydrolase [Chryseobacterium sp. JV558]MDW9380394.1 M20/M25/M40 family metallo-hydrolase [Chryseobacterium sp. JV558]
MKRKKILITVFAFLGLLIVFFVIRTLTYPFTKMEKVSKDLPKIMVSDSSVYRLSGGIKIPTVPSGDSLKFDYTSFDAFHEFIKKEYSYIYQHAESFTVNGHALVFKLKGTNDDLKPILFLSHMDVVPPGSARIRNTQENIFRPKDKPGTAVNTIAKEWDYGPFSGAVTNGKIYGRGALDMKGMLFALMEALQNTIKSGQQPKRDIYLAFGFDEEVGGELGAAKIAEYFKNKGLWFDAIYDEGGFILEKGNLKGIDANVALIGCAEKGFLSLKIKVKGLGGHSSMPPSETAIGRAAIMMQRLEQNPMKPMVIPLMRNFFQNVGGSMSFTSRLAIANAWLMESVLLSELSKNHSTNALIRTTTALTMMKGSDAPNVLSSEVEFVANFRLLPGNTIEEVKKHVAKATEGFDVEVSIVDNAREASKVSPVDTKAYTIMKSSLNHVYSDLLITPYLTVGGTDAIKYQELSDHIYRFMPIKINNSEQQSMHSTNEHISIENYTKMISYFEFIMKNYDN